MVVELIAAEGGKPIRIPASQVLVRDDVGNPLMVAGEFGDNATRLAHVLDPEFEAALQAFGYGRLALKINQVKLPAGPATLIQP